MFSLSSGLFNKGWYQGGSTFITKWHNLYYAKFKILNVVIFLLRLATWQKKSTMPEQVLFTTTPGTFLAVIPLVWFRKPTMELGITDLLHLAQHLKILEIVLFWSVLCISDFDVFFSYSITKMIFLKTIGLADNIKQCSLIYPDINYLHQQQSLNRVGS